AVALLGFLRARNGLRDSTPRNREEIGSLPGAFTYQDAPSGASHLFKEAKDLLAKGETAQAESIYRKIIEREPDRAAGYIGLAACRFYQDDLAGAEEQYNQALSREARSAAALTGLGSLAQARGDHRLAVQRYREALAIDPGLADAYLGAAVSY